MPHVQTLFKRGPLTAFTLVLLAMASSALAQTPAVVSASSPAAVITPALPAVTVPVVISRDGATPLLGFSVRLRLSSEFSTPDRNLDFAIGSFMTDKPGGGTRLTNLQVVQDPVDPQVFTVDGVTLGADCGPTGQTGTLCTLQLRSTAPSGTGTVTVQSVTLRDCSNLPIAVSAGSGASVVIDNSPPQVSLLAPNGGETWVYQTTHAITWTASDVGGGVASIDLEVSSDGGAHWSAIATGEANDGSYPWAIPNTPSVNALVRITAHDTYGNATAATSASSFTILSNSAPVLDPIGSRSVDESVALAFTAHATDGEAPPQVLAFSLDLGAPAGAAIDPGTGAFTWTPTEAQGPGDYSLTVRVTDNGTPPLDAHETISVHVNEVNLAPVLSGVPASVTIPELVPYTFTASATDADLPANTLTFSLVGAPAGAAIDPSTGVFTWTPTEAQGPGTYPFAVRVGDGTTNTDAPITIDVTEVSISAITDLSAAIVTSGNDADGTTGIALNWTPTPSGTSVAVYRARFGGYPTFDGAGGAAPATPSSPPSAGGAWELTAVATPGQTDEVNNGASGYAGRDYWYYVAFVLGEGANVSGPSNVSARPNYLLGDVSDGTLPGLGRGDNKVDIGDISTLGGSYGFTGAAVTPVSYLDVGPTSDHSVTGLPLTDGAINFEDLVMFAIDFGLGSTPQAAPDARVRPATALAGADRLLLEAPASVAAGEEFDVPLTLEGTGRLQAVSAVLSWKPEIAEPIAVASGTWLRELGGVALSPKPGAVDVALLGVQGGGFAGSGQVAVVRFRALAAGKPDVGVARLDGRDAANRTVDLSQQVLPALPALPAVTMLASAYPNPFQGSTMVGFSLRETGPVSLSVYGVDGRRVRTLAAGRWEAGPHQLGWDGRDDQGRAAPAGVYFVRLDTAQGHFTKRIARVE